MKTPVALLMLAMVLLPHRARGEDSEDAHGVIVCPAGVVANVKLAAREIRRYVYLRTGTLLPIAASATTGTAIRLTIDGSLDQQQFRLQTAGPVLTVTGGSDVAVLYGAYALVEKLGVRFQIDGDVIPDARVPWVLPVLDETRQPLFALRGLQPFHDFPEGPDWWTQDDWKALVGQAAKLRMNFIGLHTYPFQHKEFGPEPTVWIGLPDDVNADGTVRRSDVSSWYNNQKTQPYGCYRPGPTSAYSFGGAEIFPADRIGPEVSGPDDFPFPKSPAANVAMIDRTGIMLRAVFELARQRGMKTCVGTESPLDIPDVVQARLKELGMPPQDPATVQKLYEGMFQRIMRAYPVDYYWIWGHEGEIDQARFLTNLRCARAALLETKAPFALGICGWGWITQNFPTLDQELPKDVVFSSISMALGNEPVSPNFGRLQGRQKWAIPWLEDDDGLSSPQLWVGRMRKDAVDARTYGCTGLMGLHWRTRILGPNISALTQAAWEQGAWSQPSAGANTSKEEDAPRFLPVADFYQDWAGAQFGTEAATAIAGVFTRLDGKFPRACNWNFGPGVMRVNRQPWEQVAAQYRFVEELAECRVDIRGAGNRERFDWWLNTFRFARAMAQAGCVRGALDKTMAQIDEQPDPPEQRRMAREQALPLREQMVQLLGEMSECLLATLNKSSELGTVVNIEQQSLWRTQFLTAHDTRLELFLGVPLPATTQPWKDYRGQARLVVMTARGSANKGEELVLPIITLAPSPVESVTVHLRPLGRGAWRTVAATHLARAVYQAPLPAATEDFEYYVEARTAAGETLRWPVTAPELSQSVIVADKDS
jgi:hypothetical protein